MTPTPAQLRWTVENNTLKLADGTTWKLPKNLPEAIRDAIGSLPFDYFYLGNAAADAKEEARMVRRSIEPLRQEVRDWKMKYENIKNLDINSLDKIVAILSDDLELACNLLVRISIALGIQPGGEFYETIRALVEKYGIKMHYAKDYSYEDTTGVSVDRVALVAEDIGPARIEIRDGKTHLVAELPPGSYPLERDEDDPFDYTLSIWKDTDTDEA